MTTESHFERCPACGGDVHRVASRCKHCGVDLRAARTPVASRPVPVAIPSPAPEPGPTPAIAAAPSPTATVPTAPPPAHIQPPPPGDGTTAPTAPPPSSRLLWVAGAAMLIAIGAALGIMLERASANEPTTAATVPTDVAFSAPRKLRTAPNRPSGPNAAPDPTMDPFASPFPTVPRMPSMRMFRSPLGAAPPSSGPAPDVDEFVQTLTGELCAKLSECADIDPSIGVLCQTISANIGTDDLASGIAAGRCEYDGDAARVCLDGLGAIDCSQDVTSDPFAMLGAVDAMFSCLDAVHCAAR